MFLFEALFVSWCKTSVYVLLGTYVAILKKSLQSVENLRYLYLKRGLPVGTDSITAKNSDTDDEVVVQLENVRKTVR